MGRVRKQRVVWRRRRRTALQQRVKNSLPRWGLVLGGLGVGVFLFGGRGAWVGQWIDRHTPVVRVVNPLPGHAVDVSECLPAPFWLWMPGMEWKVRRAVLARHRSVRDVQFVRHFRDNRVDIRLTAREPLVWWKGQAVDAEGVVFGADDKMWPNRPVWTGTTESPAPVAPFLFVLSTRGGFWKNVASLERDPRGDITVEGRSGWKLLWGAPVLEDVDPKLQGLQRVMQDARSRWGGIGGADLRFWRDGRVIVTPGKIQSL